MTSPINVSVTYCHSYTTQNLVAENINSLSFLTILWVERAILTWVSPDLTHATALEAEWCRAASLVSGAWAKAGMSTVPGLSMAPLSRTSHHGGLRIKPKKARVGASRSPEPCLEVVHPHCQVLLAKANQKGSPDSRGEEISSIL